MTIRAVEAIPIAIRDTTERMVGYGKISIRRNVVVIIHDDSGYSGVAETAPIPIRWGCDETPESIVSVIQNYITPLLVGQDPTRRNSLLDRIRDSVGDIPYALAGICDALYELNARMASVPLYDLLGGRRRDTIPAGWSISIRPEAEMAAEAATAVSRGAKWIKVKIGKNPAQDARNLSAIREAVGPSVAIHIDANGQYSYLDAVDILPQMEVCRPTLIEQPVAGWDIRSMKSLRAKLRTPLMADESCRSYRDLQNLIANDAADAIVLKLSKHGGIRETTKIVDLAESHGMMMYPSIHYTSSIGVATHAHFYATIPNITPGSFHQGAALFEHDLTKVTPKAVGGEFPLPEGTGIGLDIDPELLERARVDRESPSSVPVAAQ